MQAIEFDAMPQQHTIRVPDSVPDGVSLRVVLLWEPAAPPAAGVKGLLASAVEGLTDDDLARTDDRGREEPSWGI